MKMEVKRQRVLNLISADLKTKEVEQVSRRLVDKVKVLEKASKALSRKEPGSGGQNKVVSEG